MVHVLEHPLIKVKLSKLRDKNSSHLVFSDNLNQIASLMVFKVFEKIPLNKLKVETPIQSTTGYDYAVEIVVVGILRAGLGLMRGLQRLIPQAKQGHIGIFRDKKTFTPHFYYYKIPKVPLNSWVVLVDPMLATGGTASFAISKLKKEGFKKIFLISIVGVKEGINRVTKDHPDVEVYLVAIDPVLNEKKYIVPGLGDAGDRIFGTK